MSDGFHPYSQACARPTCGHDIDTHFADRQTRDQCIPGEEPKTYRGACLGFRCDCKRFIPPKDVK